MTPWLMKFPRWALLVAGDVASNVWAKLEQRRTMRSIYVCELDEVKQGIREQTGRDPHVWNCPCKESKCCGKVVFARGDDGVWFSSNQTFQDDSIYTTFRVNNDDDFAAMLNDTSVHPSDRMMYALWLQLGLRDALLGSGLDEPTSN